MEKYLIELGQKFTIVLIISAFAYFVILPEIDQQFKAFVGTIISLIGFVIAYKVVPTKL